MARPKNPAHRAAILASATRTFAAQGLAASTAAIAKEAKVSTGTLFVYFETKSVLINALFVELKSEMGRVASAHVVPGASSQDQLHSMWNSWMEWATTNPDKRRALAHLSVAEELTAESHAAIGAAYGGIGTLLTTITAGGGLRGAPIRFVSSLMSAFADATIDDLINNPDRTGSRSHIAFNAMWRALAG